MAQQKPIVVSGDIKLGKLLYYEGRDGVPACIGCHKPNRAVPIKPPKPRAGTLRYAINSNMTYDLILKKLNKKTIRPRPRRKPADVKIMRKLMRELTAEDKKAVTKYIAFELHGLRPGLSRADFPKANPRQGDIKLGKSLFLNGKAGVPACIECHNPHARTTPIMPPKPKAHRLQHTKYSRTTYSLLLQRMLKPNISSTHTEPEDVKLMLELLDNLSLDDKRAVAKFVAYELYTLKPGLPPKADDYGRKRETKSRSKGFFDLFD